MRVGYAGRGLVYLVVAGFSLYALWYGGQAQGTGSALAQLEATAWGGVVLVVIAIGLVAYTVWRAVDALYDLEAKGSGGKGLAARAGMAISGLVYLGLAFAALSLVVSEGAGGGSGGGSSIPRAVDTVMGWPAGRWLVAAAGLAVIGAGIGYGVEAWKGSYRKSLRANRFTTRWNWMLRFGVLAHAVVIAVIGFLLLLAAWRANPSEAGGTEEAFEWLHAQAYGQVLVTAVCVGLLGFALFCFVNAAYRIVPRVAGDDVETLARRLADGARRVAA
jgi:Domain of Unknown Function (DUF1206)